jgi:inorganic pyrophosphatase
VERHETAFWRSIDSLVAATEIVIDRPKGTHHPRFPAAVYPVDYGYLANTRSMDGGGIDVWVGSAAVLSVEAIVCTVDTLKRDSEIKLLIGCTPEEVQQVYRFHNEAREMKGLLILRS